MDQRLEAIQRRLTDTQDVMIALSEKVDQWEGERASATTPGAGHESHDCALYHSARHRRDHSGIRSDQGVEHPLENERESISAVDESQISARLRDVLDIVISVSDKMDRWECDGVPAADSQRAVSG